MLYLFYFAKDKIKYSELTGYNSDWPFLDLGKILSVELMLTKI